MNSLQEGEEFEKDTSKGSLGELRYIFQSAGYN